VARLRLADGLAEPPAGPAAEDVAGSVITWLFAPGSFAPLARLTAQGGHGLVTDQVGAPLVVLDGAGEVRAQLVTDSRGRVQVEGDATLCPWRFAGQYRDTETGLHYNRHRYYDADAGQYISRDPLGLRAGLRVYGYVADAGVQSDPLGLSPKAGDGCGGGGGDGDETLSRLGTSRESAARLGWKAAEAEEHLGIHGVSVSAGPPTAPASRAARETVEEGVSVHDTPTRKDPLHRTVELPKPVTQEAAELFNRIFGRAE